MLHFISCEKCKKKFEEIHFSKGLLIKLLNLSFIINQVLTIDNYCNDFLLIFSGSLWVTTRCIFTQIHWGWVYTGRTRRHFTNSRSVRLHLAYNYYLYLKYTLKCLYITPKINLFLFVYVEEDYPQDITMDSISSQEELVCLSGIINKTMHQISDHMELKCWKERNFHIFPLPFLIVLVCFYFLFSEGFQSNSFW